MNRLRLAFALLLAGTAVPALAQERPGLDQRVDRVERELRAVQRKVFPGGTPAFSEPEIGAAPAAPAPLAQESVGPLNALTGRVDSLERELERLTGQVEQIQHRLGLASEQAAKDRQEFDTRLKTLEAATPPAAALAAAPAPTIGDEAPPPIRPAGGRTPKPVPVKPGARPTRGADADQDDAPPPSTSATATTGDPAEDAYMAAYDLWTTKKYPEAEAALKRVMARYPKHRRASYAQNLLGRAYLDDGQPATAAEAFAANYQANPRGERAPDSLYYLGQALIQLKKPADACRVYAELDSAYGDKLSAALKTRAAAARKDAKCK